MTDTIPYGTPLACQHTTSGVVYYARLGGRLTNGVYVGGEWTFITEAQWREAVDEYLARKLDKKAESK